MRCVVAALAYRYEAARMLLTELLWVSDVVDMRGEVAAELTKARRASESLISLFAPLR